MYLYVSLLHFAVLIAFFPQMTCHDLTEQSFVCPPVCLVVYYCHFKLLALKISANRLRKIHIMLGGDGETFSEIKYHENAIQTSQTFTFDPERIGRYLKIWLDASEYLTICEIEVFGRQGKQYICIKLF